MSDTLRLSSEIFPSDGRENRVDEVEEGGEEGEHLRDTHTERIKGKVHTFVFANLNVILWSLVLILPDSFKYFLTL